MKKKLAYLYPQPAAVEPVEFDPELCNGCGACIEVCQIDVFTPNPKKGAPPIISYPGECWYCGCCVGACPRPGAIRLHIPLMNRVRWVEKK